MTAVSYRRIFSSDYRIDSPRYLRFACEVGDALDEIAEPFARPPLRRVAAEQVLEHAQYLRLADILANHPGQPFAVEASAEIEVVFAGRPAGQGDLGDIGAGAAGGTAADREGDRRAAGGVPGPHRFDPG